MAPRRAWAFLEARSVSEALLLRRLLVASSALGARLFRNQTGRYQLADGRWIASGLAVGSPDLVGWQTVTVTPEMVGRQIAVFVGIEAKTATGRLTEDQRAFQTALARAGARVGVARSVADIDAILGRSTISSDGVSRRTDVG